MKVAQTVHIGHIRHIRHTRYDRPVGKTKPIRWRAEKNQALQCERGVSFEEVLACVENGGFLATLEHPNTRCYENQKLWVVQMRAYACLVSFVETDSEVFLKTIIPSRKAGKQFLQGADDV